MNHKENGNLSPEKAAIEIEAKVLALFGIHHGDIEAQQKWVEKNGKKFREIFEKNKTAFMDVYKDLESRSDLPQIIKMAMDRE